MSTLGTEALGVIPLGAIDAPGSSALSETMAITDTYSAVLNAVAAISETMSIADSVNAPAQFSAAIAESVAATDSVTAAAHFPASISESVAIADLYAGVASFSAHVSEVVVVSDVYDRPIIGPTAEPVTEGWWHYFYTDRIVWIGYDPSNLLLEVYFTDDSSRTYSGVPFGIAQAFVTAADPDNYYNNAIKNNYTRVFAS